MRIALVASLLLIASVAQAVPFVLDFQGRVTTVEAGAPGDFTVGDSVSGMLFYDSESPTWLKRTQTTNDVFGGGTPTTSLEQLFVVAGLELYVGSHFGAGADATEYLWQTSDITGGGDERFRLATGRLLSTLFLGSTPLAPGTLLATFDGPTTAGIQIDLTPAPAELSPGGDGAQEASFASLTDGSAFAPTGGEILFGDDRLDEGSVRFEITGFTIRIFGVPEPGSLALLLGLTVTAGLRQRRR